MARAVSTELSAFFRTRRHMATCLRFSKLDLSTNPTLRVIVSRTAAYPCARRFQHRARCRQGDTRGGDRTNKEYGHAHVSISSTILICCRRVDRRVGVLANGQRSMPELESNRQSRRIFLFLLDRRRRLGELLLAKRRTLHLAVEQRRQLGRRQRLADRRTQSGQLLRHVQSIRQRLPGTVRLDDQSVGRVLHRREL